VETDAIHQRLAKIGVDFVQGYGIAKPIPLDQVLESQAATPTGWIARTA
jgi:EAL domain-containing protein (putative c-di-GMP-specific phosphodiesterase class I)